MPGGDEGAARAVADIIASIDRLSAKERQQVYTKLLGQRAAPGAAARGVPSPGATVLPNPATVLPNSATVLPSPVTSPPSPALSARAPSSTQPRTYLAERGVSAPSPMRYATIPLDLKRASTWPRSARWFLDRIIDAPMGKLKLMRVDRVSVRRTPLGFTILHPDIEHSMPRQSALRFIDRFILPMMGTRMGQRLLESVVAGRHWVGVVWAVPPQRFDMTFTKAESASGAGNPAVGSKSVVFLDERSDDWREVPDLDAMPDIGFFHELVHAEAIQQGKNDGLTEREARILENRYRNVRGARTHRELP